MKNSFLLLILIFLGPVVYGQFSVISGQANRLYAAKNYEEAGRLYILSAGQADFKLLKQGAYYNAACCYARSGKTDSALLLLNLALKYGFNDAAQLKQDGDLVSLHALPIWKELIGSIQQSAGLTDDPSKAQLITTDVQQFWNAHDLVVKDTGARYAIYKKYYLDAGTDGLQDYFAYKIGSLKAFVDNQDSKPKFYAAIRKNTSQADWVKPAMTKSFENFQRIYPGAVFPNVYFLIGAFSSGGSSTPTGLLISLDMAVGTPDIPMGELGSWERNNLSGLELLVPRIAHELIHYNQGGMARDTTLLCAALLEGMADFMGELISGKNANPRQQVWARGKEAMIMADFKREMYLNRAGSWIANGDQETADKPADLGYWVGYQICKAYYDQSADKNKAVYDMLHIQDYRAFYEKSGIGKKW